MLRDVVQLYDEIPGAKNGGLVIGYISEQAGKQVDAAQRAGMTENQMRARGWTKVEGGEEGAWKLPDRLYSCVIDGAKMNPALPLSDQSEPWVTGKEGVMLRPTYMVELPTDKMGKLIYNGKADNQQSNLIFTRGEILQAIDMNQEGYMEEALKLPCALQEFSRAPPGCKPPSIVGFREYIFSNIGAMGDFAGGSELAFGTLVQRTMTYPLWSRLHYGHPDMLDKLAMVGQGGMSKGDKFVNLSEDIFAGMDATLRGRQ